MLWDRRVLYRDYKIHFVLIPNKLLCSASMFIFIFQKKHPYIYPQILFLAFRYVGILFLIHLFAWEIVLLKQLIKQLEIEETKTT